MERRVTQLTAKGEDAGKRLDQYLVSVLPDQSRSRIQQFILEGEVLVNTLSVKPSYKIRPGDRIEVSVRPRKVSQFSPEDIPLTIVFEDEDLIVIDKPAGLVVHPGAGIGSGTLANALAFHFQQISHLSGPVRPGIVHRLDKNTSGLMIVAKNDLVHAELAAQFKSRHIQKTYIGLVYGVPSPAQGRIEAPVGRHPFQRVKMAVRPEGKGRMALTLYQVIEKFRDAALLELNLKTGRTHQIRVHLATIRHPIIGDDLYGGGFKTKIRDPNVREVVRQAGRHFLHAAKISFRHPRTEAVIDIQSDLPMEFEALIGLLRGE